MTDTNDHLEGRAHSPDPSRRDAPAFSVIVPTHGHRGFLAEAVQSVLDQNVDLEVLVVDDAGGGVSALPRDPRIRVVERRINGGAAAARNTGIAEARGRFIAFLDDDDRFAAGRLSKVAAILDHHPIAVCRMAMMSRPDVPVGPVLHGDVSTSILKAPVPNVGVTAVRAGVVPRFDETFRASEDVEWWLRLAQVGSVGTVDEIGLFYRDDHDAGRLTRQIETRLDARLRLLELHADYFRHHPRAAAYHWRRAGGMAAGLGRNDVARSAFARSLRFHPRLGTALRLARTFVPGAGHH